MDVLEKRENSILNITILQGWNNKDEKRYSFNDLTDCYLYTKEQCKRDFSKKMENQIMEKFKTNVKQVQKVGSDFYKFIIENEIKINQLRLKIISFSEFKLLYIISKRSFLSDKVNKILDESHKITDKHNYIDISFMPYNKLLNIDKLLSDGFTFTYGKK